MRPKPKTDTYEHDRHRTLIRKIGRNRIFDFYHSGETEFYYANIQMTLIIKYTTYNFVEINFPLNLVKISKKKIDYKSDS